MRIIENAGSDKIGVIKNAIENGNTIVFFYEGKDYRERKARGETPVRSYRRVEPFAIGKTKAGNWVFRGYQYVGATNTKNEVYKLFRVDEIKGDIKLVYDKDGQNLRSYEPREYIDDRGKLAKYNELGDFHMKSGVDAKFDPDMENLANLTSVQPSTQEPTQEPTMAPKPTEPITPKPGLKPGLQQKPVVPVKPEKNKPAPEPVEPEEPIKQTEPEVKTPEEEEDEWVPTEKPIQESTGFLKWFLKFNYGSK
jgi:hypothetical protein